MAKLEDEIEVVVDPKEEVTSKYTSVKVERTENPIIESTIQAFPSIHNNFRKHRTSTGNSSNVSYTSCTSLLTQYIKVENKLKWKFLPEQQAGCLLVITEQILNDVLDEEIEVWTGFQTHLPQNESSLERQNATPVPSRSDQRNCQAMRYISHSKNLSMIHQYFQRFTKGNACVKLCIASPPPLSTAGFSFPESVLRPIEQPDEPNSHFAQFDRQRLRTEVGQRQLGQLNDDDKRALELAYLCAEFPVLSAPPPPELEQDEVEDIQEIVMPKEAEEPLPFANGSKESGTDENRAIFHSMGGLSIGSSSFCSRSNTLSPISTNTFDINLNLTKAQSPPLDKLSEDIIIRPHGASARIPKRQFSESQHIETVEMLLAHLRQAFGLGTADFTTVSKSVRSKVGLFVKGYSGKSETLYRELEHRYQVLEKGQHPYYRQNAFPTKSGYDSWLREEKAMILKLIDGFYHKKEADVRVKPSIRIPLPRDLHKSYSILLSTLLQYELGNCLTGYLNPHEDDVILDGSIDSLQQLSSLCARTEKGTFHPSTTRLLEEYALRYGISQTYRHLALLDCLTREFNIHSIQDCKIIESIISKLISKLNRLSDVISAHPRTNKPQAANMVLLKQEKNIFLQTLNQLSRKIQQLMTNGIEKIISLGCTEETKVSVKRILNRSVLLLELVMDTYQTLSNLTNNQAKGKNNSGSVKDMLSKWLKGFVAETYGQQKLRIASDHRASKSDQDSTPTLSAVMMNKLLSIVSLEIRRIREYYQEPLRNYFNASQLVTSEYYRFICQDIEYLCRRHCRELKGNATNRQKIEERDLNMLGLMFNLDQQDTDLWTSYLPEQSITWREEFLRLFIEKWNASIKQELSNFIKTVIKSDEWEPNNSVGSQKVTETEREGEESNLSRVGRPLAQSRTSAFSTLQTRRNFTDSSGGGPMVPQSAHARGKIRFTANRCSSISDDEAAMRDNCESPSTSEQSLNQYEVTFSDNPPSTQLPKFNLNLSVIPVRESLDGVFLSIGSPTTSEGSNSVTPTPQDATYPSPPPSASPVNHVTNVRFKLPLSNSIVDLIIVIARYNALIINILQTLSPLKFIWNRSHVAHTGLPLEMLEAKKLVEETREINTNMKSSLYAEANQTLSKICLTFAYNLVCMDYCGLKRGEALEILNGDETKLLDQLDELKRDRLAYGCRHTKQYGINASNCRESRHSGEQRIEKLSKDVALRINNIYVLATMWERLNSQLLSRMSTRNLSQPSAYFWSTTTTDMQSTHYPNKQKTTPISGETHLAEEEKSRMNQASITQKKLEEALRFEINILAYRINSGFLQLFSVLIELNLPQFNEKQRLAPALNYLGDCLNYLGRYLYPDAFKYLLQRIWYNTIKGLETKAKVMLKQAGSEQRAREAAELYLHVLSCLINFFKSTPDSSGLDAHLLMETSEFFSYLLHFHLLESKSLLRVFDELVNELNSGYRISYINSKQSDSQLFDIENTITAHTGLSRGEVIAYLHVKLSSFRKSFTGKELKQAVIALRAETLPNEWKSAQCEWSPIAVEICKDLIERGDIEELKMTTGVDVQGEEGGDAFSLTKYYRIVHIRRVICSIRLNREDQETDFKSASLTLTGNQESHSQNEEAKLKTLQYLYEILKLREKDPRVREFLRSMNDDLVAILSRGKNGQFDKLLIVHEQ